MFPISRLSDFVKDTLDSRTVHEGDRGFLHRLDVQSSGLVGRYKFVENPPKLLLYYYHLITSHNYYLINHH